ncbi:MAG: ABATE domain-containing protein [Geminicoccaceae bacterium]
MAEASPAPFKFIAGNPALDFVNSVSGWVAGAPRGEHLRTYGDLVAWGLDAGLVAPRAAKRLLAEAARQPRAAAQALSRGVALRDCLHRLFAALAQGRPPARADLEAVNAAIGDALAHQRLVRRGDGFVWDWDDAPALDRVLWPVLRAVTDLLTSERLARVRECGGERCHWLFLDETKNASRRWCDMSVCGNRAKARRHYDRSHGRAG